MSLPKRTSLLNLCSAFVLSLLVVSGFILTDQSIHAKEKTSNLYRKAISNYLEGRYTLTRDQLVKFLEQNPGHEKAKQLLNDLTNSAFNNGGTSKSESTRQLVQKSSAPETGSSSRSSSNSDTPNRFAQKREQLNPVQNQSVSSSPNAPPISGEPSRIINHDAENPPATKGNLAGVSQLEVREYEDRIRVRIGSSKPINYISSKITEPPMVIVDIPNSVDQLPESPLPVGLHNIPRIRHSQYRRNPVKTTRVVVDLSKWNDRYRIFRSEDNREIVIDFFKEGVSVPPPSNQYNRPVQVKTKAKSESGYSMKVIRGDSQQIPLKSKTENPLSVRLLDGEGNPVIGEPVRFTITSGSGQLLGEAKSAKSQVTVETNKSGRASVYFRSDTTAGINQVKVTTPNYNLVRSFTVKVKPGRPQEIVKISGNQQRTLFGHKISRPLVAEVRDTYGNPVPGVLVRIQDQSGKGLVDVDREEPGAQRLVETNKYGRVKLNFYRIPSDIRKNHLRMSVFSTEKKDINTTFTVFGEPQLISIDFKDANLQDVLRTLAELANWNIALPEEGVDKKLSEMSVTVHLREVTALRALDTILDIKKLSRVADGNLMKIVTKSKAIKKGVDVLSPDQLEKYEGNNMVSVAYQLTYLKATKDLANQIRKALLAENASIVVDRASNSVVITDLANNQRRLKEILNQIDRPDRLFEVRAYELQNTSVEEVANGITRLLPTGQGNVVAHKQTNTLLVFGDPSTIKRITKIVNKLDEAGTLVDYWRIVDVEGYDAEQLAKRVNSVLAIQLFDVGQLESFKLELAKGQSLTEVFEGSRQVDIGKLLNSAAIVALPNMEKILVFGPPDIRKTAVDMINKLKRKPGKYLTKRSWEWIDFDKMPVSEVKKFINQTGGIKIQINLPNRSAMLVSAQRKTSITRLKDFIKKIEGKMDFESDREIMVYRPVQAANPAQLATRIDNYLSNLTENQGIISVAQRVIYTDEDLIVLAVKDWERKFLRKLFKKLDQPLGVTKTYQLKNASISSSTGGGAGPGGIFGLFFGGGGGGSDDFVSILKEVLKDRGIKHSIVTYGPTNTILYTVKKQKVDQVRSIIDKLDQSFSKGKIVVNYQYKFVKAKQIRKVVQNKNLGQLLYADQRRMALLVEEEQKQQVLDFLRSIDRPSARTHVVRLDHRNAQDLANTLQTIFGQTKGGGGAGGGGGGGAGQSTSQVQQGSGGEGNPDYSRVNIGYDNSTNSVFFSAPEGLVDDVKRTINKLDVWQKQVLIEARLVEIRLENSKDWSPEWVAQGPRSQLTGASNLPGVANSDDAGGIFNSGATSGQVTALLAANEFNAVMQWVAESDRTKVLTRPSITALNNSQAQLDLTEQRFFPTIQRDDEGNPIATTFESQKANKVLNITPTITSDQNVLLDVVIKNDVFGQRSGPNAPFRINTRQTENSVMIHEGQTLVLGGIIQKNRVKTESGIPYVKDLPIIGRFARQSSKQTIRTELVVFLTPHIIDAKKEVSDVTKQSLSSLNKVDMPAELKPNTRNGTTAYKPDNSINKSMKSDTQKIRSPEKKLNLNKVDESDFRGIFDRQRYKALVQERKKNGLFTGWNDVLKRMNYTGDELTLLQRKFYVKIPKMDLNGATVKQLKSLPGIDRKTAQNIVDYRYTFGDYERLDQLTNVPGVDKKALDKLRSFLKIP